MKVTIVKPYSKNFDYNIEIIAIKSGKLYNCNDSKCRYLIICEVFPELESFFTFRIANNRDKVVMLSYDKQIERLLKYLSSDIECLRGIRDNEYSFYKYFCLGKLRKELDIEII